MVDGGGAECVGGAEQDVLSLRTEYLGQFADGRGLAGAVDSDHQNYFRRAVDFADRPRVRGSQNRQQLFFQQALEFLNVSDLFVVRLLAELAQHFLGGRAA